MPVEPEIQNRFERDLKKGKVGCEGMIIHAFPDQLATISQEGNRVTRTYYDHTFRPYSRQVFSKRSELQIETESEDPVKGFVILKGENSIAPHTADFYLSVRVEPAFKASFSIRFVSQRRSFDFQFNSEGKLINFFNCGYHPNGESYYLWICEDSHDNFLQSLNSGCGMGLEDKGGLYQFSPSLDDQLVRNRLTVNRFADLEGLVTDHLVVSKPHVLQTRILEEILVPELIEDPTNPDLTLDESWRSPLIRSVVIPKFRQRAENDKKKTGF